MTVNAIRRKIVPTVLSAARALAIASLFILVVACGDDDDDDASDDAAPQNEQTQPADQPGDARRQGGELTVATNFPVSSLDPHRPLELSDFAAGRMLWRGLYSLDGDNNVVVEANGIADGLPDLSPDGATVTVSVREGLQWSDGNDLRAEDYVAGFIRACNPVLASDFEYLLSNIVGCDDFFFADRASADLDRLQAEVGVKAIDELTIQFELVAAQPTFATILALPISYPAPVHLDRFAAATPAEPADWGLEPAELAYNGPYQVVNFAEGGITLEPNPNWSGATRPTLDRLTLDPIDDPFGFGGVEAFRNGLADTSNITFLGIQEGVIAQLAAEFGDLYISETSPQNRALQPRLGNEALAMLDVRLALARAIDREALNEAIAQGLHQPATSWIPQNTSAVPLGTYDELLGYDPEAARAHLAAAGYPEGAGFPLLTILVRDDPRDPLIAAFLSQAFKDVLNIEVEVEVVDIETRNQRISAEQFDLLIVGWSAEYPDMENWILGLFNTGGTFNFGGCSDPEIDAVIEEARLNLDDEERRELYREAERLVLEQACTIPFWHEVVHFLVGADVVGMRENFSASDLILPGDYMPEAWGLRAD